METIIIYTKYYLQAVVEILDNFDLNVQIISLPSYDLVLKYVKTTPNVIGVIFLEHRAGYRSGKAYKAIITALNEIAEASRQVKCVSIIATNDIPAKIVPKIPSKYLTILLTKYTMLNTDTLRYQGIAAVIAETIGISADTALLELNIDKSSLGHNSSISKTEFLKICLEVVTGDKETLDVYRGMAETLPELNKLYYLRENEDNDEVLLNSTTGIMQVFAKLAIERRKEDV